MTPKPDTPHRTLHAGIEYLFCCAGCKTKFDADPARYLAKRATPATRVTGPPQPRRLRP
jgi:Cu+-exporting ATPase